MSQCDVLCVGNCRLDVYIYHGDLRIASGGRSHTDFTRLWLLRYMKVRKIHNLCNILDKSSDLFLTDLNNIHHQVVAEISINRGKS